MLSKIQPLTMLALLLCLLQPLVEASNYETTISPTDIAIPEAQALQCSVYFQEIVAGIYDNNFANFDKVLRFAEYSSDPNFKADILAALYNVSFSTSHAQNPLHAIPLYNEVEALLNAKGSSLQTAQLQQLEYIGYALLWNTIVPKGADILEAAVYLNSCNHANTTVGQLLDLLHASNETLTVLTFRRMVNSVRWVVPVEELLPILGNFSIYVSQNVEVLLALYNEPQFQGDILMDYFFALIELQQDPAYNATVSAETQHRVNTVFPTPLQSLYGGDVCLHQQMTNGSRFYIQECLPSYRACIYVYPSPRYMTAFKVAVNRTTKAFTFRSGYYGSRFLLIRPGEGEQASGFKLNVWSPSNSQSGDFNWKVQLNGNQVILQNMNSTMFLCAGHRLALQGNQWFAYTRNTTLNQQLQDNECKWSVDNCKGLA